MILSIKKYVGEVLRDRDLLDKIDNVAFLFSCCAFIWAVLYFVGGDI